MQQSPNRITLFWQELKRRKVTRVVAIYAAAAFVILELTDIVAPSLGLPDWTLNLIIILLCVGFIITVIVSWIYDLHPDGGVVKTEPAEKVKAEDSPKSSNSWKIASYISFVVIVGLIALNVIPRSGKKEILDKSIAVLPLDYLSENPEKEYLANGVLDAITGHLSMIEGLRVMPRTSVEQYREDKKSVKEIGEELDVSYLVEGSFLMVDDQVKLTIQLVVAEEGDHILFKEYDRDYSDIFSVQSEVAQSIAREIEVAISPEEKQRIEKIPTTSLSAYDYFLRGKEEHIKYRIDNNNTMALDRAEQLYFAALEIDPFYAMSYVGLASAYWDKHYWGTYWSENFLDTVLIYVDMALGMDDKLAEAYSLKGDYYLEMGDDELALRMYEKAISLNPNDWSVYEGAAKLYRMQNDLEKAYEYMHEAVRLNHDQELPRLMRSLGWQYFYSGFQEKYKHYLDEAFKLDRDSIQYFLGLRFIEVYFNDDYSKGIDLVKQVYGIDSNNVSILESLGYDHELLGQIDSALIYYEKLVERLKSLPLERHNNMHHVAFCYWKLGGLEEADYFLDLQKERCEDAIELNRDYAKTGGAFYDLACVYAFKGDKVRTYENLSPFRDAMNGAGEPIIVWFMIRDPFFDNIRDEPEFQQIVQDVEAKYQAEHERVRQWLEENEML